MKSLIWSLAISFPLGSALGILRIYTDFPYYLAIPCYMLMGAVTAIACKMMFPDTNRATKNKPESR